MNVIKQINDSEFVVSYDDNWIDIIKLSDLEDSVIIEAEDVPALIKELKKFHKKATANES